MIPGSFSWKGYAVSGAAALALGAGLAIAHEHRAPWGLQAKLERANGRAWSWKARSDAWEAHSGAMKAAYDASEDIREEEQDQAEADVRAAGRSCDARVAEARRATLAIRNLVNQEPARDPVTQCPAREFYDPRELRDAIQTAADPAAHSPAEGEGVPAIRLRGRIEAGAYY